MCGRYTRWFSWRELADGLGLKAAPPTKDLLSPSYNVCPSQIQPIARMTDAGIALTASTWGLVPSWARVGAGADFKALINARSETAATKPSFRDAFKHRRCVVPISGFYEWRRAPGNKSTGGATRDPFYITLTDEPVMLLAGLWEQKHSETQTSFAILTTDANALVAPIHHRMPVILQSSDVAGWLNAPPEDPTHLFAPFDASEMSVWQVNTRVNRPIHNDPSLIEPDEQHDNPQLF